MPKKVNIIIKYPSRSRPHYFKKSLTKAIDMLSFKHNVTFVCSFDDDDETMKTEDILTFINEKRKQVPIDVYYNPPSNKISATNANLESYEADMLILCQDDMRFTAKGYDDLLAQHLFYHFPNRDGVLQPRIIQKKKKWKGCLVMPILGWKYFKRFNYIFNPVYKNLYADNELAYVSEKLGKLVYIDDKFIVRHDWDMINDELRKKTEMTWKEEEALFNQRKSQNFDLVE